MPEQQSSPTFSVISGAQVHEVLGHREKEIVELTEATYLLHHQQATVNPPSYFLRFPDRPTSRIIALPASVGGDVAVDGVKWISSFPENIADGIPRASAVLILNDQKTGYPFACLESSIISAVRTAASAALAAQRLSEHRARPRRLGIVGTGLIARYIHTYLAATGWQFDEIGVHDLSAEHAEGFRGYLNRTDTAEVKVHEDAESLIRASDLVVFATVAATPHVTDPGWFSHAPLVLNVSLRDLSPEVVLAAENIVDDVDHCLRANTSVHLAEQATGNRDFLNGTLAEVITGEVALDPARTLIFSPFGLGVLDLAVGRHVHDALRDSGELRPVDGFFHDLRRHGE
ncbi:2,3-diaminopropionate biosynthesis protein SbnB [Amycolatopsis minnesotensis]|uniref:2,3-diaminopropionate biosynthesis protein SbnB n=1 Tax=Amycolatopsis minnesotensis TaxID=337894 RepID=A0ABP5DDT4_9PSEU